MRTYTQKDAKLIPDYAKRVFKGVLFDTYQWQQKLFDGSLKTFEMLKRPDTVVILALKDGQIILLEQEQPNQSLFYDFPSGRHDDEKETELEAAKRELLEETGMRFENWKLVHVEQPHTKIEWFIYTFVATDLIDQIKQNLDAGEKITVKSKTLKEIKELWDDPKARYTKSDLLMSVDDLDQLVNLPELK